MLWLDVLFNNMQHAPSEDESRGSHHVSTAHRSEGRLSWYDTRQLSALEWDGQRSSWHILYLVLAGLVLGQFVTRRRVSTGDFEQRACIG